MAYKQARNVCRIRSPPPILCRNAKIRQVVFRNCDARLIAVRVALENEAQKNPRVGRYVQRTQRLVKFGFGPTLRRRNMYEINSSVNICGDAIRKLDQY